jgi:phage gp29-like protein
MIDRVEQMPPKPKTGEIVTDEILQSRQYTTLSLAKGFAGTTDPSNIWQSMMRDQWQAFTYYRELEEKDEDVAGAIEELKLSVLSRERTITPADDSSQAAEVAAFIEDQINDLTDFHLILDNLLDAAPYGVAIAEIIFDVSAGQVGLLEIKDRPQELFSFAELPYLPQIGPLRFKQTIYDASGGVLVPENKFIVFSYRQRGGNRRGRPLLRSVFWPSWFRRNVVRFWLRFAEKGAGTAAVKYPQGASQDEKQKALEAAEAIIERVAIAVPENFGLIQELLTQARTQDPAVFEKLDTRMEEKIRRRIVGQTLTSHASSASGAGSRALGQVHQETKVERTQDLARALETVINDQLVKPLTLWNYGPNVEPPKFAINKENEEDLNMRSQVDARLQSMGVPLTKNYALKKYSIPEPKATDEILQPIPGAAPGAGGGQQLPPGDPTVPPDDGSSFGDQFDRDIKDVDRLMAQLKQQALDVYTARVKEVIGQVSRGGAI